MCKLKTKWIKFVLFVWLFLCIFWGCWYFLQTFWHIVPSHHLVFVLQIGLLLSSTQHFEAVSLTNDEVDEKRLDVILINGFFTTLLICSSWFFFTISFSFTGTNTFNKIVTSIFLQSKYLWSCIKGVIKVKCA
jgi:hypothetical protein